LINCEKIKRLINFSLNAPIIPKTIDNILLINKIKPQMYFKLYKLEAKIDKKKQNITIFTKIDKNITTEVGALL